MCGGKKIKNIGSVPITIGTGLLVVRLKYRLYVCVHLSKWFTLSLLFGRQLVLCTVVLPLAITHILSNIRNLISVLLKYCLVGFQSIKLVYARSLDLRQYNYPGISFFLRRRMPDSLAQRVCDSCCNKIMA